MAEYEAEFESVAEPARVWAALVDVEDWPRWISSYTSVRRVDDGPLAVGSKAEVKQPGLSAATYTVSELDPGREFTWQSSVPGVRTTARHVVEPAPDGGTRIRLSLEQSGLVAGVVGLLLGGKIRRYLQLEGRGLCTAAESGGSPQSG